MAKNWKTSTHVLFFLHVSQEETPTKLGFSPSKTLCRRQACQSSSGLAEERQRVSEEKPVGSCKDNYLIFQTLKYRVVCEEVRWKFDKCIWPWFF